MRPDQEEFFTVLYREYFNQIKLYAMEVRVAVAVVLKDPLRADPHAKTVEGVCADLTGLVGTLHHAVRLVIEIGRNGDILGSGGGRRANLSSPNCPVLLSPKNCQQWNNC